METLAKEHRMDNSITPQDDAAMPPASTGSLANHHTKHDGSPEPTAHLPNTVHAGCRSRESDAGTGNTLKMYATSPDRYTFLINNLKKNLQIDPNNKDLIGLMSFYESAREKDACPSTELYDLERDLRSSSFIVSKCKNSETYSQNLYAALCDNEYIKKENVWITSWRHSGGIISNLRESGDYIDWYCSGMSEKEGNVEEGVVTLEVEEDLHSLGWSLKR